MGEGPRENAEQLTPGLIIKGRFYVHTNGKSTHLSWIGSDPLDVLRNVDDAPEDIVARGEPAAEEDDLRAVRHPDEGDEGHQHGHGAKGEGLRLGLHVVARVVDEGGQAHYRLAAAHAHEEGDYVRGEAAVGVAVRLEVHDHQQLRE